MRDGGAERGDDEVGLERDPLRVVADPPSVVGLFSSTELHAADVSALLGRSDDLHWTQERHKLALLLPSQLHLPIRYDTRCYFNVRSKADIGQLNLPHQCQCQCQRGVQRDTSRTSPLQGQLTVLKVTVCHTAGHYGE